MKGKAWEGFELRLERRGRRRIRRDDVILSELLGREDLVLRVELDLSLDLG